MYREDGNLRISPSDIIVFLESEFASWMDRWAIDENPASPDTESCQTLNGPADLNPKTIPDEDDLQSLLFAKKGMEHEIVFLEKLKSQGKRVVEIDREKSALYRTIEAMKDGAEIIYQARIETSMFGGWADFLAKCDGAAEFEPYHYEPLDTKLA